MIILQTSSFCTDSCEGNCLNNVRGWLNDARMLNNNEHYSGQSCTFAGVMVLAALANRFRLHKLNKVEKFVMSYGGLRGAVAFALVLLIDPKHVPLQPMFVTTTIAVIYFTVFIQVSSSWNPRHDHLFVEGMRKSFICISWPCLWEVNKISSRLSFLSWGIRDYFICLLASVISSSFP